jgi:hypothetical protein
MLQRLALVLVLLGGVAHAEPSEPDNSMHHLHFGLGFESSYGGGEADHVLRVFAGNDRVYGTGAVRGAIGIGGTASGGCAGPCTTSTACPSGCFNRWDIGPELVAGLRFHEAVGAVDTRVYASAAPLVTSVEGYGAGVGFRGAVGASWVPLYGHLIDYEDRHNRTMLSLVTLVLPWQGEVVYEHDDGANRVGFLLGWGV